MKTHRCSLKSIYFDQKSSSCIHCPWHQTVDVTTNIVVELKSPESEVDLIIIKEYLEDGVVVYAEIIHMEEALQSTLAINNIIMTHGVVLPANEVVNITVNPVA